MSKTIAELLAEKHSNMAQKPQQSLSDIKHSLGSFAEASAKQSTPAVVASPPPSSATPPVSPTLPAKTKGIDMSNLGSVNLDDVSVPSFFGEHKSPEFSTPEQREKYEQEQLTQFKQAIQNIHDSLGNKTIVTDAIRFVYAHLREHEFLKDMIEPADMGTMVAGLRESYGTVIAKKNDRSSKRAQNQKEVSEIVDLLGDVDIKL